MTINMDMGEAILKAYPNMKVDVHHPDIMLNIEIREEIYIYSVILPGPGGLAFCWFPGYQGFDGQDRCGIFPCTALHQ